LITSEACGGRPDHNGEILLGIAARFYDLRDHRGRIERIHIQHGSRKSISATARSNSN